MKTKALATSRNGRIEKLNFLLEKTALVLGGAFALALPFVLPVLAPLHYIALVPWTLLFIHPRYRANSAWMWIGSFVFLFVALRPFVALHVAVPLILTLANFVALIVFPILLKRLARLRVPLALTVPAAWVVTEWIRVWFSARQLQMYFLGSSQFHWTKLIQIADIGGVYAVSFVVASVSGLIAEFLIPRQDAKRARTLNDLRVQSALSIAVIFAGTLTYGLVRDHSTAMRPGLSVAVVQPNEAHSRSTASKPKRFLELLNLTRLSLWPLQAELVVWPENSIDDLETPAYQIGLIRLARHLQSPLLIGVRDSAYLFSSEGAPMNRYERIRVTFWSDSMALQAMLLPDLSDRDTKPTVFELPTQHGVAHFSTPIGLEISDLQLWREAARGGVDFLVNITNEGRVGDAIYTHLLALSTFRAVENRIGVIRAANDGLSAFIDSNGRTHTVASIHRRQVIIDTMNLDPRHGTTLYSRFGDAFVLLCAVAVVIAFLVQGVRGVRRSLVIQEELHAANRP